MISPQTTVARPPDTRLYTETLWFPDVEGMHSRHEMERALTARCNLIRYPRSMTGIPVRPTSSVFGWMVVVSDIDAESVATDANLVLSRVTPVQS